MRYQSHVDGVRLPRSLFTVLAIFLAAWLSACTGDRLGSGPSAQALPAECATDPTLPQCQVPASGVYLTLSQQEIKSDGSDSATVTATVLDENNAVIEGVQVDFSADVGKLSKRFIFTDEFGEAAVLFSASRADPTNQIATITATVAGVGSASIPVRIIGTTLEIVIENTALLIATGTTQVQQKVKVVAKDAGGQLVYNAPITLSLGPIAVNPPPVSPTQVSPAQATTDTFGEINAVLTATAGGAATLMATGLGTFATVDLTVADAASAFHIVAPVPDPITDLTVMYAQNATPPTLVQVNPATAANITLSTSVGSWSACGVLPRVTAVTVPAGSPQANLYACDGDYGFATVVAADAANATVFDKMTVVMSPPTSAASLVFLQSDVKTLPPSTATTAYSATITASVVTNDASGNYPIVGVPVAFTLANTTGGGESLSNSYGVTDSNGQLVVKFTSGITATGQKGVQITGSVVGGTGADSLMIEIGGTGGSVSIGVPVVIKTDTSNLSVDIYNMSVIVADGTGAGVAGSKVTLEAWPKNYYTGVWYDADPTADEDWRQYISGGPYANEDLDEDLILDRPPAAVVDEDVNKDMELTPKNSDAGAVPSYVVTLADGTGPFDYTYLKSMARWVEVRIKGSTKVLGTELTSTVYFVPEVLRTEVAQGLVLASPFKLPLHASSAGGDIYEINVPVGSGTPYLVRTLGCSNLNPLAVDFSGNLIGVCISASNGITPYAAANGVALTAPPGTITDPYANPPVPPLELSITVTTAYGWTGATFPAILVYE